MKLSNLVLGSEGSEISLDKLIETGKVVAIDRDPKEKISVKDHHGASILPREVYTICSNIVNDDSVIKVYRLPICNLIYGRHPSDVDRYDRSYVIEAELNSNQHVKKTIFHDKNKEDYDKLFMFLCRSGKYLETPNNSQTKQRLNKEPVKDRKMKKSKEEKMKKSNKLTLPEKRELLKKLAQRHNFFTVSLDEYGEYEDGRGLIGILVHRDLYTTVEVLNGAIRFTPLHGLWDIPTYTLDADSADFNESFRKYLPLKDLSKLLKDKDMPKVVEWVTKKTSK